MTEILCPSGREITYRSRFWAVLSHLRFGLQNAFFVGSLIGLCFGGVWLWAPFVVTSLLMTVGDEVLPKDIANPANPPARLHDAFLVVAPLLITANALVFATYFSSADRMGVVAFLGRFGIDLSAARAGTSTFDLVAGMLSQSLFWSFGLVTVHEFCHRPANRFRMFLAQWVGSFAFEAAFFIHHPNCHHRRLAKTEDFGTPKRGDSLIAFAARAMVAHGVFAFEFERDRLVRRRELVWSVKNRFLVSQLVNLVVAGLFIAIAGPIGIIVFAATALTTRLWFEATAYVEHYGLVRAPGEPLMNHFAWDCYHRITNDVLINAGRHVDHHRFAGRPCQDLRVVREAPMLPHGYLTMVLFALAPPLYRHVMRDRLADWDRRFATDAEIAYMAEKGIPYTPR